MGMAGIPGLTVIRKPAGQRLCFALDVVWIIASVQ
jgi:hypothetical protein